MPMCVYTYYIYIYIHTYNMYVCIYIYIYVKMLSSAQMGSRAASGRAPRVPASEY